MKYKLEIIFAVVVVVFAAVFLIQNAHIQATAKPGQETWQGSDDMGSAAIEATGYTPGYSLSGPPQHGSRVPALQHPVRPRGAGDRILLRVLPGQTGKCKICINQSL